MPRIRARNQRGERRVQGHLRHNLGELGTYRRGALGTAERVVRRVARRPAGDPRQVAMRVAGHGWKREKYRRGELVEVDATPFLLT